LSVSAFWRDTDDLIELYMAGPRYGTMETTLFNASGVYNLGVKYDISPTATLALGVDDVFNNADEWRMHPTQG